MAEDSSRLALIERTLTHAIARQKPMSVGELDVARLAVELDAALRGSTPFQPLDPEGDGLESSELNAANDV